MFTTPEQPCWEVLAGSNAADLGVFMQMLLQNGSYGEEKFLDSAVIADFTRCQYCEVESECEGESKKKNRRGAGFDRPEMDYSKEGPTCKCISPRSFGHTGFTGTMAWADPKEQIVYVFLSNRIHPDAENKKLVELNIRTEIMQAIYDALNTAHFGTAQ